MKICKECGTSFIPSKYNKTSQIYCSKKCNDVVSSRVWIEKNRKLALERGVWTRIKRVYGLTKEQYYEIKEAQGSCCAICLRHESEFKKRLNIDHDHQTGELRGMLCGFCNRYFLGRHRDPEKFRRAATYLEKGLGLFVPEKYRMIKKRKCK